MDVRYITNIIHVKVSNNFKIINGDIICDISKLIPKNIFYERMLININTIICKSSQTNGEKLFEGKKTSGVVDLIFNFDNEEKNIYVPLLTVDDSIIEDNSIVTIPGGIIMIEEIYKKIIFSIKADGSNLNNLNNYNCIVLATITTHMIPGQLSEV